MMNLVVNGMVKDNEGREFSRLLGGFGEDKPCISDKQIAEILGYAKGVRQVRVQINNNIDYFESEHIIDLQRVHEKDTFENTLKSIGYASQSIKQAKNIYILSHAGFLWNKIQIRKLIS